MNHENRLALDRIVFIGRTYFEYMRMFDLGRSDLEKGPVLDCAAGPSSFTAEACEKGFDVTACDVLYETPRELLVEKGRQDIEHTFQKVDDVPHLYVWKYYRNRDEIISLRNKSLDIFSRDFPRGFIQGRYVHAALPRLPFPDKSFSLVLSSHFLFLYGDRLDLDFHKACLKEMARVSSGEVRIFPLQGLNAKPYHHMKEILSFLKSENVDAEIREVPFEFQKGSNKVMRLKRR